MKKAKREVWLEVRQDGTYVEVHDKPEKTYKDNDLIKLVDAESFDKLAAENWVLHDTNLRTYDGMARRADKYDKVMRLLVKLAEDINKISEEK